MYLIFSMILWGLSPIIIRHDKDDLDYQHLVGQFELSVCHLWLRGDVPDGVGTLIHRKWILTAVHCAVEIDEKLKKGEKHQVMVGGAMRAVDTVILHAGWVTNEAYDIALIRIESAVPEAVPVVIYTGDQELNKLVYVAGMGDTGNGIEGIRGNDGHLRAATNRVDEVTDYWLKWTFDNPDLYPDKATEYEGISGPGDSGGPAFIIEDGIVFIAGISSGQSTGVYEWRGRRVWCS